VAVYEYYNGSRRQAEAHAERAIEIAQRSGAWHPYGEALATSGYLAYMRSDGATAARCLDEAVAVAGRQRLAQLELRGALLTAATELASGNSAARTRLMEHVEDAKLAGWDEMASTGYSSIVNLDVEHGRYRDAERVIETALPFSISRDIPICRQWQTAVRSRLQLTKGHWSAALEDAGEVLDHVGMPLATLWPHLVTALVPLRRGEALRRLAVLAAVTEHAWMIEGPDPRLADVEEELHTLGTATGAGWASGHLAVWLRRIGRDVPAPADVAEPFRLSLDGRHVEAAEWWRQAGDPFAEAMALTDCDRLDDRARGVELLDRLGATGTADRLRIELRRAGMSAVPQRPRVSTRANPGGLTNRQLDVARLVARGMSNSEIATRLYISPKTADHHVSAILGKLDLPNRRAVVVQADELGLA
jgi:DNA-binding CsgD family transcriptional regulator